MRQWIPTGNKILVRVEEVQNVTDSGIIIVTEGEQGERAQMNQFIGTIVAVGPMAWADQWVYDCDGNRTRCPWAQVGDRVKFTKFAGYLHFEEDEPDAKYRVMHDLDVVLVYQGEDDE